jgi:hypothetical protein
MIDFFSKSSIFRALNLLSLRQKSSICCRSDEAQYFELSSLSEDTFNLDLIVIGLLCRSGITCHMGVKSRLAIFF